MPCLARTGLPSCQQRRYAPRTQRLSQITLSLFRYLQSQNPASQSVIILLWAVHCRVSRWQTTHRRSGNFMWLQYEGRNGTKIGFACLPSGFCHLPARHFHSIHFAVFSRLLVLSFLASLHPSCISIPGILLTLGTRSRLTVISLPTFLCSSLLPLPLLISRSHLSVTFASR